MSRTRKRLSGVGVLAGLVILASVVWPTRAQIPDKFKNLQVLPKETSKMDLVNTMKEMTFALGTRCWYCHEGEGDDLSTFDFASDKKEAKGVAREMMGMVGDINSKYITKLDADAKVTCYTCHRGQPKPEE